MVKTYLIPLWKKVNIMSNPNLKSGIYECTNCGNKCVHTEGETFPPCTCETNDWTLVTPTNP